jgi:hypothetical protein
MSKKENVSTIFSESPLRSCRQEIRTPYKALLLPSKHCQNTKKRYEARAWWWWWWWGQQVLVPETVNFESSQYAAWVKIINTATIIFTLPAEAAGIKMAWSITTLLVGFPGSETLKNRKSHILQGKMSSFLVLTTPVRINYMKPASMCVTYHWFDSILDHTQINFTNN